MHRHQDFMKMYQDSNSSLIFFLKPIHNFKLILLSQLIYSYSTPKDNQLFRCDNKYLNFHVSVFIILQNQWVFELHCNFRNLFIFL